MYGSSYNPDVKAKTQRNNTADTVECIRIKYIGTQASGIVDIAATTGDITFKHGAAGAEAADTTLFTNGICDLSGEAATFQALLDGINLSPNWEAWPVTSLPGDATEASGTAKIMNNVTGAQGGTGDCKVDNGYALLSDTSAVLYHSIALTENGPRSKAHPSDAQVEHRLYQLKATSTYGSGTSLVKVYEVDDVAGTSTEKLSLTGGATTVELAYPTEPEIPILKISGKRMVVRIVNSAAMTAQDLFVVGESEIVGAGLAKNVYPSHNQ